MRISSFLHSHLSNGHPPRPLLLAPHYSALPFRVEMLKPYPFRTQCALHCPLPLPFNPIPKLNPSSLLSPAPQQPIILCAGKNRSRLACSRSRPSNLKILQLASILALNLKILPEPFNFLAGELARGHWSPPNLPEPSILTRLGARGKKTSGKKRTKLAWFAVFALICGFAGFWSWRVSELDVLVRALLFGLVGFSLIRLRWGKKAIKEWVLGFLVGVFLMMSCGLGKENLKYWVERVRVCSPAKLIVGRKRNRNWRILK